MSKVQLLMTAAVRREHHEKHCGTVWGATRAILYLAHTTLVGHRLQPENETALRLDMYFFGSREQKIAQYSPPNLLNLPDAASTPR